MQVQCCVQMPNSNRNYCKFNYLKAERISSCRENAIPYVKNILETSKNESQILETLYIADKMIDKGTKGMQDLYPTFARHNETKSPNIQTFLSGIYRKTQVPDAFGPLIKMLFKNIIHPPKNCCFDPNEEIGGAILSYLS